MKPLILILGMFCFINAKANDTVIDGKEYIATYFKTGEISTLQYKLYGNQDALEGPCIAYDITGKEIYRQNARRWGGYGNVKFSYYENGAVNSAHYTSHPDGGIQRTDITTYFDKEGTVTKTVDLSTEGRGYPILLKGSFP